MHCRASSGNKSTGIRSVEGGSQSAICTAQRNGRRAVPVTGPGGLPCEQVSAIWPCPRGHSLPYQTSRGESRSSRQHHHRSSNDQVQCFPSLYCILSILENTYMHHSQNNGCLDPLCILGIHGSKRKLSPYRISYRSASKLAHIVWLAPLNCTTGVHPTKLTGVWWGTQIGAKKAHPATWHKQVICETKTSKTFTPNSIVWSIQHFLWFLAPKYLSPLRVWSIHIKYVNSTKSSHM